MEEPIALGPNVAPSPGPSGSPSLQFPATRGGAWSGLGAVLLFTGLILLVAGAVIFASTASAGQRQATAPSLDLQAQRAQRSTIMAFLGGSLATAGAVALRVGRLRAATARTPNPGPALVTQPPVAGTGVKVAAPESVVAPGPTAVPAALGLARCPGCGALEPAGAGHCSRCSEPL